ncbi:MAG: lipopolysaccharide heptosyltransferase II [Candidatus Omnitrophota bacterium]|nr:lipopolysaccharide heptosyltransferase II [Candidatus Omnitrophota bacterium]MBU1929303.1 lipopolysaccharide heptosyltransferase II [Candidatus Omnitrophota bacterium]MBU2035595.1 lipopolysaccharide heptosyltransferase II [Candidatus Omnitrophota bacterium]MBU2258018.1 lipopolysaccharide heptosyltransferase II [Candidatus Omnitrophota bacterium]
MTEVKKILFITLSNIGDVIMTLPVFDYLKSNFPKALITIVTGPRPSEIFQDNPNVFRVIVYEKSPGLKEKIALFKDLKKENFDLVVDLRNSLLNILLKSPRKVSPFLKIPRDVIHMKERHFYKAVSLGLESRNQNMTGPAKVALNIKPDDIGFIESVFRENSISKTDKIFVVSPGARSHIKRWPKENFLELIIFLINDLGAKVVLAGDKDDALISGYIVKNSEYPLIDLCGKTNLRQLACLLQKADLLITNDSANLHLAGYLGMSAVGIFGPTNELKYGPWPGNSRIVKKDIFCRPCQKAQCRFGDLKCLEVIKVKDVIRQVQDILDAKTSQCQDTLTLRRRYAGQDKEYKRILITRTDRIGDVVLSTPAIKALRMRYPSAYIAMMVSPYAKDIVIENPDLDEVIILDKDNKHKNLKGAWELSRDLKKKRFDLAIALHPTNRVHLIIYSAGIPRKIGYDRKFGFLFTDKIRHLKQLGQKRESEYNFDLLKPLGIEWEDQELFFPLRKESEIWVDELFAGEGIKKGDSILAINPGASCPSRIWPVERFVQVAERFIEKHGFKIIVLSGSKEVHIADEVIYQMKHKAVNLGGKTSVSQLASVLKRCSLLISNDSGPVHIACALGTPVVSIFSRSQEGLSPKRWGPVGKRGVFLHKDVGCIECLAHNCVKGFLCLKAITVEDVIRAAESILGTPR